MEQSSQSPNHFRVIVVGAGIAGLTAALCLQAAGIDHVVVEKNAEAAPPTGASITLFPGACRILNQVNVYPEIQKHCQPMRKYLHRLPDGSNIIDSKFFEYMTNEFNMYPLVIERRKLLRALHRQLSPDTKIRYRTSLKSVVAHPTHVTAVLSDDTEEHASLIIGADGVHSIAREQMWHHANNSIPNAITTSEKTRMVSTWRCLVGISPSVAGVEPLATIIVHNTNHSVLLLTQETEIFFFVFFKNDEPFTYPTRKRYTATDADELAEKVASHRVSKTALFGEIWRTKIRGALVDIEEGVLDTWFSDRIVLVGDAVHKMTPNAALGGNTAIESVACLVNHLHKAQRRTSNPDIQTIHEALEAYVSDRKPTAKYVYKFSSIVTKLQAWQNWLYRGLMQYVLPYQPDNATANAMAALIKKAPWLECVPLEPAWQFGDAGKVIQQTTTPASLTVRKSMASSLPVWKALIGALLAIIGFAAADLCGFQWFSHAQRLTRLI